MGEEYPKCPRCGSKDTRAKRKVSNIFCRRCGYLGPWREFFPGPERDKAIERIKKGKIEGESYYE